MTRSVKASKTEVVQEKRQDDNVTQLPALLPLTQVYFDESGKGEMHEDILGLI